MRSPVLPWKLVFLFNNSLLQLIKKGETKPYIWDFLSILLYCFISLLSTKYQTKIVDSNDKKWCKNWKKFLRKLMTLPSWNNLFYKCRKMTSRSSRSRWWRLRISWSTANDKAWVKLILEKTKSKMVTRPKMRQKVTARPWTYFLVRRACLGSRSRSDLKCKG